MDNLRNLSESVIFPKGEKLPEQYSKYFIGTAYLSMLVSGGHGFYQEEGKPAQELHQGDVVKIAPNIKHWHGAAPDSWFVHLSIETNVHAGPPEWLEPVTDAEYNKLK